MEQVQVKLTEEELEEAVREWCNRRGVTVTDENEVRFYAASGGAAAYSTSGWKFTAGVEDIIMPPKDGPYR